MKTRLRSALANNWAFLALFTLLSLLLTWPAVLHLRDRVVGAYPGDNFHFLWELWYVAHAVFDLHRTPFFDPDIYVPFGFDLIKNQDLSPGTVLLFLPLTRLIGEVATYNLLIIVSFALTTYGAYLLAYELWQNKTAALFAGLSVGFCDYRYTHAEGHLSIVTTQWILFFFLYLERTLKRPTAANGALVGLFYALCAWATWYYAWSVPIAAVPYLLVRVRWTKGRELVPLLRAGVTATGVALLLILPFAIPYAMATSSGAMAPRSLGEAQTFAASVIDYFIPAVRHSLWGGWVRNHWRAGANGAWLSEWELYLGTPTLLLALVGAWFGSQRRVVLSLLTLAFFCFLVSLGPSLYLIHPAPAVPGTNSTALSPIHLPGLLLNSLPPFSFLRAWARLGFFVEIAAAMLAAGGIAYLLEKLPSRPASLRVILGLTVIVAITLDGLAVPIGLAAVSGRTVDRWLAEQPGRDVIMEFPIPNHGYSGPAMYSTRLTNKRLVLGYASYPPNGSYFPTLAGFPSEDSLDLLESWRVNYVLVDANLYQPSNSFCDVELTWPALSAAIAATSRLHSLVTLEGVHVYRLQPKILNAVGSELLSNPSFEATVASGSDGWSKVGRPKIDPGEKEAHSGHGASQVDPTDYFNSSPIPIEAGSYYALALWGRRATSDPATSALEVDWLDEQQHALPAATSLETTALGREWLKEQDTFRAPAGSHYAVVRATTHSGKAWVDDYSFYKSAADQPMIEAIPNQPEIPPVGQPPAVAISWNSHGSENSRVTLSVNGQTETPFAAGSKGTQILEPITLGSTYEFRLYDSAREPLQRLTVAGKSMQLLSASPVRWPPKGEVGVAQITWRLPSGQAGEVWVSVNGAAEALFARGDSGTQDAPWIARGNSYEFRLYATTNPRHLLGKVSVTP